MLSDPEKVPIFQVVGGADAGRVYRLDRESTLIGRNQDCDVVLEPKSVSRRHAEFIRHGTAFEVKDLGSLNGTYFDGVRVESAILTDGAEVQVGKFRLTFYAARLDLDASASA